MPDVPYVLGHSRAELRRLMLQAAILRPITARLLREAGLTPGMRVLDLGCGSGDVAMLAAELVGPNGAVVGIDRSAEALAVARERATAGYANIEFRESAAEDFVDQAPFDLAIGRYVLVHQGNPPPSSGRPRRMCGVAGLLPSMRSGSMANVRPFPRLRFGNRPGVGLPRDLGP
jgi:SAM-dependent methyltransferase